MWLLVTVAGVADLMSKVFLTQYALATSSVFRNDAAEYEFDPKVLG